MDFADISEVVKPLIERLDHRHLGTWESLFTDNYTDWGVEGLPRNFYPTSENLLNWIGEQLHLQWSLLSIEETCTSRATLTRKEFDERQC
jgi:6-pyruvoyl-tetrahydropterin synthase